MTKGWLAPLIVALAITAPAKARAQVDPAPADLRPFEIGQLMFGFEWELAAHVALATSQGAMYMPTDDKEAYARIGDIKMTYDSQATNVCAFRVELITEPMTLQGLDALMADFRAVERVLDRIEETEPIETPCWEGFTTRQRPLYRPLILPQAAAASGHLAQALNRWRVLESDILIGYDAPLKALKSQHVTFPVRLGVYHKTMTQFVHYQRETAQAIAEMDPYIKWVELDDEARDVWYLFLREMAAQGKDIIARKNYLSPKPRPRVRDLFHAIRSPQQRAKFADLRRYCTKDADIAEGMPRPSGRAYDNMWTLYCTEPYFGTETPGDCTSIELDGEAVRLCDEFGARRGEPYVPFIGYESEPGDRGEDIYFLVEDRKQRAVSAVVPDNTDRVAQVKEELRKLLYDNMYIRRPGKLTKN